MNVYCVGGAIRDELLGLPVQDRDWVVVGASPQTMLAQGFLPVGRDFPVFLHPETHEEYALARTERKVGAGYRGFEVHYDSSVSLEDDLSRRDLTINAMARGADGVLIDPFNGRSDLALKVFRHVSEAFEEDPVRVLRLARFSARFVDFSVAPETKVLITRMLAAGELEALVAERVWQELSRGLMEAKPSRMFAVLAELKGLPVLAPELVTPWRNPNLAKLLDRAAGAEFDLAQRFATLTHELDLTALQALAQGWHVPNDCNELAALHIQWRSALEQSPVASAHDVVDLWERTDAKRKPRRFMNLVACAQLLKPFDAGRLLDAHQRLSSLDEASIAKVQKHPSQIRSAIHEARLAALAEI